MKKDHKKVKLLILTVIFFNIFLSIFALRINAQQQTGPVSANDPKSYQCFDNQGNLLKCTASDISAKTPGCDSGEQEGDTLVPQGPDPNTGNFFCTITVNGTTESFRAYPKPVTLMALQFLFVKILYAVWGFMAGLSFVFLIGVGYDYLLRGGTSDEELVKLRKRILNYIIGFVLVFLALPILTTVFNVLGVNTKVACYNVAMPGFQFFFASLCTDPSGYIVQSPCDFSRGDATGYACSQNAGQEYACSFSVNLGGTLVGGVASCYICDPQTLVWSKKIAPNCPFNKNVVVSSPCSTPIVATTTQAASIFDGYRCPQTSANTSAVTCSNVVGIPIVKYTCLQSPTEPNGVDRWQASSP